MLREIEAVLVLVQFADSPGCCVKVSKRLKGVSTSRRAAREDFPSSRLEAGDVEEELKRLSDSRGHWKRWGRTNAIVPLGRSERVHSTVH